MFSVCIIKHLLERGVIVIHIVEEPLIGELLLGQVDPISLLAEYTVLPLILVEMESRNCLRLMENKESKKLDGMESSKSKSDAHLNAWMR